MDELISSSSFPKCRVGVATSRTDPNELCIYYYYKPSFPMVIDEGGEFLKRAPARATPNCFACLSEPIMMLSKRCVG